MAIPFAECLVLVGIHSYLGLHVIRRQVIFVDLSLAQIAALGTTAGFLAGIHPHSTGAFLFSLSFTFIGAAIFALTRTKKRHVPQEAIIGLVYALAAALVILVIDRAPHGAEHIKEMMTTGNILLVKGSEVIKAAIAYAAIGVFHYIFRDKFLAITNNAEEAEAKGINVAFWDLLFYMSFGFVITISVNTAGLLLVFVFLVVPAVIGAAITDKFRNQLIIGWIMGTIVSMAGLTLSYWLDLPTGPAVVAFYGIVLLLVALSLYVIRAKNHIKALRNLALGILALGLVVLYFEGLKKVILSNHHWTHGEYSGVRMHGPHHKKLSATQEYDNMDMDAKAAALKHSKNILKLQKLFQASKTPDGKIAVAERAVKIDPKAGSKMLFQVLASNAPSGFRDMALQHLKKICHKKFDIDLLTADHAAQAAMIAKVRQCLTTLPASSNAATRTPSQPGGATNPNGAAAQPGMAVPAESSRPAARPIVPHHGGLHHLGHHGEPR
ncbi:MAG: metal ABC transporter permease [Deltaproteobacteria bacterium]|nr:metal ABC transporter permease [Deltaproteobacteria bacterium]